MERQYYRDDHALLTSTAHKDEMRANKHLSHLPRDKNEKFRCVMNINVNDFEKRFLYDSGEFSYPKFYEEVMGAKSVKYEPWMLETSTNSYSRLLSMIAKIEGSMFIKSAYTRIIFKYSVTK